MSRVLTSALVVLLLGALLISLPVSASQFPEQLPSITKEEANSLGLIISYGRGGGGWEGSNYINFYQDFMCANHSPDYNNYIEVMVTYYTDNEAVDLFNWHLKDWPNYTDHEWDITDDYGQKVGVDFCHYEFDSGRNYATLKEVCGKKYFDGHSSVGVRRLHEVLVGEHYLVSAEVSYLVGSNACNLEGLAPVLLNMYLSRIPNSTVRVPVNASGEESTSGTGLSQETIERMKDTNEKLKGLGEKWGGFVVIKTPKGEVVRVVNSNPDYSGGGSVLGWKAKYYGNKALDAFIDQVANYLPKSLGLFKDYFKADKDINVFSDDEMVKKTVKDLHVDERSASLYNGMSDIENREKAMSPYKNAVPSSIETKPIEIALNSMGVAIKKTLAQDYRWEFEKTAEIAIHYKKSGMKYRDIIRNTIEDMSDTTTGMHRVNMLDRNSKGDFKSQEARVRFYINKLFEEGVI
ncbi:hypothetical protein [Thermococcus barophilus]|uniref:Uncharacterized protein n=1 Tax=Thermococcus barophilus TaxID=55802 RepID=A0A0S1XCW2_THEBA|nr:hypothetical protein [Thermococcus barophilus]ALM75613.1 conserved exported hypothetical protein [Thermococcus barophilus]